MRRMLNHNLHESAAAAAFPTLIRRNSESEMKFNNIHNKRYLIIVLTPMRLIGGITTQHNASFARTNRSRVNVMDDNLDRLAVHGGLATRRLQILERRWLERLRHQLHGGRQGTAIAQCRNVGSTKGIAYFNIRCRWDTRETHQSR